MFKADVLACARCEGRLEIVATVTAPSAVKAILECLGLPARPRRSSASGIGRTLSAAEPRG